MDDKAKRRLSLRRKTNHELFAIYPDVLKVRLRRLLAPHGISLEDVLAFGDDIPDVDLLTACGTAVVMGNCVPAVSKLTEFCTIGNDEDGVAVVLEAMLDAAGV